MIFVKLLVQGLMVVVLEDKEQQEGKEESMVVGVVEQVDIPMVLLQ